MLCDIDYVLGQKQNFMSFCKSKADWYLKPILQIKPTYSYQNKFDLAEMWWLRWQGRRLRIQDLKPWQEKQKNINCFCLIIIYSHGNKEGILIHNVCKSLSLFRKQVIEEPTSFNFFTDVHDPRLHEETSKYEDLCKSLTENGSVWTI